MKKLAFRIVALALPVLSPAALAGDWYVDAVNGDDNNSGTLPTDAWRTVSRALSGVPAGSPQDIHVAPGAYNDALGENFPLVLRPNHRLLGPTTGGEARISAGGAPLVFKLLANTMVPATISHLTIKDATDGISYDGGVDADAVLNILNTSFREISRNAISIESKAYFDYSTVNVVVQDCVFRDCEQGAMVDVRAGDAVGTDPGDFYGEAIVNLSLLSSNFRFCGRAVGASSAASSFASADFRITVDETVVFDCDNGMSGNAEAFNAEDTGRFTVSNSSMFRNAGAALGGSGIVISVTGTLLADNLTGLSVGYSSVSMDKCTVANNDLRGISLYSSGLGLSESIVYGNGDDLEIDYSTVVANYSDIGDGDFAGSNGNFSQNPRFLGADLHLYQLRSASPCIDAGDPNGPPDLDGSIADIGAFPYDPLFAPLPIRYCEGAVNSTGVGAGLSTTGSVSIASNDLTLVATDCPATTMGLFFYGGARIDVPFGDGLRCVGAGTSGIYRLGPAQPTDSVGTATRLIDFTSSPASTGAGKINPGSNWNFQFWYRDLAAGGAGFNLTDGRAIWFLP